MDRWDAALRFRERRRPERRYPDRRNRDTLSGEPQLPEAQTSAPQMDEPSEETVCVCCCLIITPLLHISCRECEATLCIQCFRMGAEVGKHKRGHNYAVIDHNGRPTFDKKGAWGSVEEKKLIQAAHKYKLGNWTEMRKMMETTHSQNECILYFDTYFIRGPIGQFALRELNWHKHKDEYRRSGFMNSLLDKHVRNDLKYNLYLSALRWKKDVTLSAESENLKEEVRKIAKEYVAFSGDLRGRDLLAADTADINLHLDMPVPAVIRCNRELKPYDPLDPQSDKEEDQEMDVSVSVACKSNGKAKLEPNEMSDDSANEDSSAAVPAIKMVLKKVDKSDSYAISDDSHAKENNTIMNSCKEGSSGDDCPDIVMPEIDDRESSLLTEDDLHGLEKELSSESEDSDREANGKKSRHGKNHTPKMPKKRKRVFKSKKQRRLESFQKRMTTQARKRERELEKHEELVSKETIAKMRRQQQPLALYRTRLRCEKPKFRQDDMSLLSYNPERNDYEIESFNDAETLISELTITIPKVNNEMVNLENNTKFARIQKYKRALMIRNARRNAIVEHDKITAFFDFQRAMTLEKRKASEVMEQRPPMEKMFARMQQTLTKEELDRVKEKFEKFEALKERIEKLQELQRQGIISLKGTDLSTTSPKKKKVKGSSEAKRKAGLRWKAIQRQHLKFAAD